MRELRSAGRFSNPAKHNRSDPTHAALLHLSAVEEFEYDLVVLGRVYFLLDAEAAQVKIGLTGNLQRRIADLSRQRGRTLELLGTLKAGYDMERCLHQRFRGYRREGREWYSTEILPDVLELLTADGERLAA